MRRIGFFVGFGLVLLIAAVAAVAVDPAAGAAAAVMPPTSQYVSSGTATGSPTMKTTTHTPAMPHWVYQMINDFNLGISQPSGTLSASNTIYMECVAANFAFVDGNSRNMAAVVKMQFAAYSKLIPRWIAQIAKLKSTPVTRRARAKLVAAQPLHLREVTAWENAAAAIKNHDCANFLNYLKQAQKVGVPDWADQYAAVNAIAGLYGSRSASHQTPYAQKLG